MGTRADFYVGRGEKAEWLGSIAFDGYPDGNPSVLLHRRHDTEQAWRQGVYDLLVSCGDSATSTDMGWPWPWDNSATTDYAYAYEDGEVWVANFGYTWYQVDWDDPYLGDPDPDGEGGKTVVFPDMSRFKNVTYGKRSGAIFIGGSGSEL